MRDEPYIDAEYVVVTDRPVPDPAARWSFWTDDFPNIAGIIGGALGAMLIAALLHR